MPPLGEGALVRNGRLSIKDRRVCLAENSTASVASEVPSCGAIMMAGPANCNMAAGAMSPGVGSRVHGPTRSANTINQALQVGRKIIGLRFVQQDERLVHQIQG